MRMIPTPDTYRLVIDGKPAAECAAEEFGNWMAGEVRKAVADMERHGIKFAALLATPSSPPTACTPIRSAI